MLVDIDESEKKFHFVLSPSITPACVYYKVGRYFSLFIWSGELSSDCFLPHIQLIMCVVKYLLAVSRTNQWSLEML